MLDRRKAAVLIIDLQESLLNVMAGKEDLLKNIVKLVKGAQILNLPLVLTEQVKLGRTHQEISSLFSGFEALVKESFSCWKEEKFRQAILQLGRKEIIVAGIEAHICVYQTAVDMVREGFSVFVAADCTSSRTELNREIALRRLAMEGVHLTSAEMVLFELLETAGDPKAKEIFRVVK
ncbi:MAG: hydrolase [Syntrophales bacterium]|nr:hydrolase [Syntrophales bacterium]